MPGLPMLEAVVVYFMHRSASDVTEKICAKMDIKSGLQGYVFWSLLLCFLQQTKLMLLLK